MAKPEPTPEGQLIKRAVELSPYSQREVAELADLSEARLRQIMSGSQSMGGGQYAKVTAPSMTLARISDVVGVTPERLREVGRVDAAADLEEIIKVRDLGPAAAAWIGGEVGVEEVRAWLNDPHAVDDGPPVGFLQVYTDEALVGELLDRLQRRAWQLGLPGREHAYGVKYAGPSPDWRKEMAALQALDEGGDTGWSATGSSEDDPGPVGPGDPDAPTPPAQFRGRKPIPQVQQIAARDEGKGK